MRINHPSLCAIGLVGQSPSHRGQGHIGNERRPSLSPFETIAQHTTTTPGLPTPIVWGMWVALLSVTIDTKGIPAVYLHWPMRYRTRWHMSASRFPAASLQAWESPSHGWHCPVAATYRLGGGGHSVWRLA